MAYRVHLNIRKSCKKHPRYSPEAQGEGGIMGGCIHCYALLDLSRKIGKLLEDVGRELDEYEEKRVR
jgi:hypothetical protein